MKCAYCSETQGLRQCSRCGKFACATHTAFVGICTECQSSAQQVDSLAARPAAIGVKAATAVSSKVARRARLLIVWSWIFTGVIGGWIAISLMVKAFTPDYVTGDAPTGLLLLVPVAIYGAWALFWGWIPIWHGWQRFLRGIGCLIAPALLFAVIFLIMGALALVYGALGGGFAQYSQAKRASRGLS